MDAQRLPCTLVPVFQKNTCSRGEKIRAHIIFTSYELWDENNYCAIILCFSSPQIALWCANQTNQQQWDSDSDAQMKKVTQKCRKEKVQKGTTITAASAIRADPRREYSTIFAYDNWFRVNRVELSRIGYAARRMQSAKKDIQTKMPKTKANTESTTRFFPRARVRRSTQWNRFARTSNNNR